MQQVTICHLGRVEYGPAWELQRRVHQRVLAQRQQSGAVREHVVLFVEHPPVYTLGKSGSDTHLLLDSEGLAARGATFYHIDRGGDITYHGPGQLVGYPILDLEGFFTDIHRYLRELEEVIILTCRDFGIEAGRVAGRTGVWIGPDVRGLERKVCAMGIRASRWVTMHGFALNVNTDLSFFGAIIPCGITDRGVTSLAAELGGPVDEALVRERVARHFEERFEARARYLEGAEAEAWLDAFLQTEPDGAAERTMN